jgi:hypothetical protein
MRLSDILRRVFLRPSRGVVGLVDDLLAACPEQGLQLDWQGGQCRVRTCRQDGENVMDVPLRKSVFRMILARVAVLCNERTPNSVSPNGGQGELSAGAATVYRVTFVNTPDEQKLELLASARSEDLLL